MPSRTRGVVAAGAVATAQAGARALALGGNATDAVCAASFAAFIAEGLLCSPAGGGAALVADAEGVRVLDFFAAVPGLEATGSPSHDFTVVDVDFGPTVQQFHVGKTAAAVPGALRGIVELHARGGRLPLSEIVAPAVEAGRHGYDVGGPMAYVTQILAPILDVTDTVQGMFRPGARNPAPGARLDNPALADFLEALAAGGAAEGVRQFEHELLLRFGANAGGLVTARDLERYAPIWREPARVDAGPVTLMTNPPPSSGGPLIAMGLGAADPSRLTADGFVGAAHLRETAALLQSLDRVRAAGYDAEIGDPDRAGRWVGPDGIDATRQALARARRDLGSTTHISVLTNNGEFASLTMSNGEGCGHAMRQLGIHVNNFLGEEDINPGGFHQLPPGTRMTTMMAPSALVRPDGYRLVLGSGGSNRIRSAILQALLAVVVHERSLDEAIEAPRLHVEGDRLWWEAAGIDEAAASALLAAWPNATRFDEPNLFFGGVHAVTRAPDGTLHGAGDPRRGGTVAHS